MKPLRIIFFINFVIISAAFDNNQNIHPQTCVINVEIEQVLKNEGFHRNLTYEVVFHTENDQEKPIYEGCSIGLDQRLPAGLFVDPNELLRLKSTKKVRAMAKNRVNTELAAEDASPIDVYLIGHIVDSRVGLWMPVHARYQASRPDPGFARNTIDPPTVYLRCPDDRLKDCEYGHPAAGTKSDVCDGEKCQLNKSLPYKIVNPPIHWDVPVGNPNDFYTVAFVTTFVIVFGSLCLLLSIHEYKINSNKNLNKTYTDKKER